jgi:RluA family pseudouridine synthase
MAAPTEEIDDADADAGEVALRFCVDARHAGTRLDKALAELMPDVSRSRLQQWVADAAVRVNGAVVRQRQELVLGDLIEIEPQPAPDAKAYAPEPMPLAIVHEDSDILVVDKPPGLVVHPATGHWSGTLLNGLLAHSPQLFDVPRAGIVHRLDADTSGLMVVAKTLAAQAHLVRQLQERSVTREYWAVVLGVPAPTGTVDAPIGRDPRNPLRFRVSHATSAKPARTRFAVVAAAHLGRRAFLQRFDLDRQVTDHVFAERHLALHLGHGGRGGVDVHQRVMRLAVLLDAEGEGLDAPVLRLGDLAATGGDEALELLGQGIDLRVRCILASQEYVLVESHVG